MISRAWSKHAAEYVTFLMEENLKLAGYGMMSLRFKYYIILYANNRSHHLYHLYS